MSYAWYRYNTSSKILPRSAYNRPGGMPDQLVFQRDFMSSHFGRLAVCTLGALVCLFFLWLMISWLIFSPISGALFTVSSVIIFLAGLGLIAAVGLPISWYRTHRLLLLADIDS